jgi:hypothetical protein
VDLDGRYIWIRWRPAREDMMLLYMMIGVGWISLIKRWEPGRYGGVGGYDACRHAVVFVSAWLG